MNSTLKWTLFFMILIAFIGCSTFPGKEDPVVTAQYRGDARHTGLYDAPAVKSLSGELWKFKTGGEVRSSPVIFEDTLYTGSGDGFLYALDISTGEVVWKYQTGKPLYSSVAIAEDLLYIVARDSDCLALNPRTGEVVWEFKTPHEYSTQPWDFFHPAPLVVGSMVCFGGGDGRYYALDKETGREVWRFDPFPKAREEGRELYTLHYTPAYDNGILFVATNVALYAIDASNGKEIWQYKSPDIQSTPSVVDGYVYIAGRDTRLHVINAETGKALWIHRSAIRSWIPTAPVIDRGVVMAGTSDEMVLFGFGEKDGSILWQNKMPGRMFSSPTASGGAAYIGCDNGELFIVEIETGKVFTTFKTGGPLRSSPLPYEGKLFFGSDDGYVYAVN